MKHKDIKFKTLGEAMAHIEQHFLLDAIARPIFDSEDPLAPIPLYYQIFHNKRLPAPVETQEQALKPAAPDTLATWKLPANIMELPVPEQRYAIKPYFPIECATGLVGQGKIGKSYLTLLALLSVAAGRPFWGCEVTGGDAWYFSAEDRPDRVMERAQDILQDFTEAERALAIERFHAIDAVGKNLFFVAMSGGGATVTNVADRIAAAVGKAVLIVVDTVSRINPLSEQSNETMALIVSAAEKIASATGAAVCLNTHTGKAQARAGESDMYSARGGSAFGDNARSIVVLSRVTDQEAAKLIDSLRAEQQENNLLLLTHAASSYGREAAPKLLVRRRDGTLAAVTGETMRNEARDVETEMHGLVAWFKGANKAQPFSFSDVARHSRIHWTRMPQRQAEAFIKDAIEKGQLVIAGKGRTGSVLYAPAVMPADPFAIN